MENEQQPESEGMKNLREAYDREKQAREAAESQLRQVVFSQAGVDTTTWVGEQLANAYDGDLTPDAIKQFATERGIPVGGDEQGEQMPEPVQQQLAAEQAANQLVGHATPTEPDPDPMATELRKRAEAGDVQASIALKAQQFTSR